MWKYYIVGFIIVFSVIFLESSGYLDLDSFRILKPDVDTSELEMDIHELINQERISNGLNTLEYDNQLSDIARNHSKDMAENDYFSHTNLIGQGPTERAKSFGYSCYKDYGGYYTDGIAENIYQNNLYDSTGFYFIVPYTDWNSQEDLAKSTVDGWMNSFGHRQNILDSSYDKEGIGVAISSDDKVYITQDFW